ncbi:MAG TPA: pyridoxamine 5'-phosphate oxidase family protein [Planctomycetota bacterium]|nr:pyridoxamine 5'-phosphate oxidase family protein [Planctomycetota bacterium]HNR97812.1 pyridoxamine 5'-phosphate oxidase family protein [Planctomycetota bacterium]HNU24721.1 pyridoxamine 5'-phosphate oxidase family protein [Planctomycetota bacterium]HOE29923.1 pyridoxamine 5'-phosphate oxidase family protein [Planctomycetota bacterium]HOE86324.1 pyridoxamine 5'-phosphate oxidase family protein [Planctomycetota bacterium]
MIDAKMREVLVTPPDAALAIVTQGDGGPHVVNSWNSYVLVTSEGRLLIPAGRMFATERNLARNDKVLLTVANREVEGKTYKGTGFLIKGTGVFLKEGSDFEAVKGKFPWARAALAVTIESAEQTL